MRVQMSKMQLWQRIAFGRNVDHLRKRLAKGVEWFTPDFISKLQGPVLTWWKLCPVGKKALGETEGLTESSTPHPTPLFQAAFFDSLSWAVRRCGSMCAKIWKNNPHSQNTIVEPSKLDKIESNQFQLFILLALLQFWIIQPTSHVNLSDVHLLSLTVATPWMHVKLGDDCSLISFKNCWFPSKLRDGT